MTTRRLAAALLLGWLLPLAGFADASAEFEAANKFYAQGKYAEAAAGYEKLLQGGSVSATIYYNLGNAYFKAGQLGRAIAAYRHADDQAPRDPDLQANLQFARNQVQGPTMTLSWWQRWLDRLTLNEWSVAAAAGIWVCFLLLAAQQWRPTLKPVLRNWIIAAGCGTLLLCATCGAAFQQKQLSQVAIAVARDIAVRQSPLDEAPTAFTVQDGAELRVLDRKDDWLQVSTGPRRIGWVQKGQVVVGQG